MCALMDLRHLLVMVQNERLVGRVLAYLFPCHTHNGDDFLSHVGLYIQIETLAPSVKNIRV